jgi:hypothetical protein
MAVDGTVDLSATFVVDVDAKTKVALTSTAP